MNKPAALKPCLFVTTLALCAFNLGCGGGTLNDPPGVATLSVRPTASPLVAQYTAVTGLECPGQVAIEFGPDTSYGRMTAWYPVSLSRQTSTIQVAGMRASTTYHMRATAEALCSDGTTHTFVSADTTFTTGALPASLFPTLTVSRPSPSSASPENPGIEMVDVISPNDTLMEAFFTDRDGHPIWYYPTGISNPETIKILSNGHIILNLANGSDSLIREVDLAQNTIREMDISLLQTKMQSAGFNFVPQNLHHDLLPLSNGHLVVLVNFTKDFPGMPGIIGDGLIDLDENWNPVWAWNSFDYLDVNRHLNGLPDWTHSNALQYTQDGNLLLSMRHQSWILKIDYNNGMGTGRVLWRFGYQGDFALAQDGAATSDPSLWFSYQHFPSIIDQNGAQTTLAVWDNGDNRVLDRGGQTCLIGGLPSCYSRATVFEVDESAMVANLVWADQLPYFGIWGGSINQLPNGNVEFDLNAPAVPPDPDVASLVREVTQSSTPQVVWQMEIGPQTQTAYRAYRVPSLYPGVTWQY